jgi:hypothetical protein
MNAIALADALGRLTVATLTFEEELHDPETIGRSQGHSFLYFFVPWIKGRYLWCRFNNKILVRKRISVPRRVVQTSQSMPQVPESAMDDWI